MTTAATLCLHCGRPAQATDQRYCPDCGASTVVHRIDWHFLTHEFEHSVLHMDRGLLYTVRELMRRPRPLLRDYLRGRRMGHVKPLLLITMLAAAVAIATRLLQALHPELVPDPGVAPNEGTAVSMRITEWVNRNLALTTLLLLPMQAAFLRFVFGRAAGINYPEWLVVTAFVTAQNFVLSLAVILVCMAWPAAYAVLQPAVFFAAVAFACFSITGLFPDRSAWRTGLRAAVGFGAHTLATMVLLIGIAVGIGVAARLRGEPIVAPQPSAQSPQTP